MIREAQDHSLLAHNTFGIDRRAARFIEYDSADDLRALIGRGALRTPFLHIGAGSNLLLVGDVDATVLHSTIRYVEVAEESEEEVRLRVGAGTCWDDLVQECVERGWYGAENLSLIPGETGSAAVQNIGAYGVEVKDLIEEVCCIDALSGEERIFPQAECRYDYRDSLFKRPEMKRFIVTEVRLRLGRQPRYQLSYRGLADELQRLALPVSLAGVRQAVISLRRSKLPDLRQLGNAGSFFTNPVVTEAQLSSLRLRHPDLPAFPHKPGLAKLSAAWLIQACGWKGRSRGDAAVYERQALVLVNRGHASGRDIYDLSEEIICSVRERFGVQLEREVNVVGLA